MSAGKNSFGNSVRNFDERNTQSAGRQQWHVLRAVVTSSVSCLTVNITVFPELNYIIEHTLSQHVSAEYNV